jgi:hypothetical protein
LHVTFARMSDSELTVTQVAEQLGVAAITVRKWCQRGLFPNAYLHETPLGSLWMIPTKDLDSFEPPKMGRPPKPKEEKGKGSKKKDWKK